MNRELQNLVPKNPAIQYFTCTSLGLALKNTCITFGRKLNLMLLPL